MDTNYEPIFDNVFESVCEEVAEPCETNQDNLPTVSTFRFKKKTFLIVLVMLTVSRNFRNKRTKNVLQKNC